MKGLLASCPWYSVPLLGALWGIVQALSVAQRRNLGNDFSNLQIVGFAILVGAFLGLAKTYGGAVAFWGLSRAVGGNGSLRDTRIAIAWGEVPHVAMLVFWPFLIIVSGQHAFAKPTDLDSANFLGVLLLLPFMIAKLVASIWAIVASVNCLMVAHDVSGFRAFCAFSLGWIVLVLCLIASIVPLVLWLGP
jgi:hypothetical protein